MSQRAVNSAIAVFLIAGGTVVGQRAVIRADDQNGEKPAAKLTVGAKSSLDEELLKGLSNDLLEGIDDLPKLKPEEKPAATIKRSGDSAKPMEHKAVENGQPMIDVKIWSNPARSKIRWHVLCGKCAKSSGGFRRANPATKRKKSSKRFPTNWQS